MPNNGSQTQSAPHRDYIAELVRQQMMKAGIKDLAEVARWQEMALNLELGDLMPKLEEYVKATPQMDITNIRDYITTTKINLISEDVSEKKEIGEEIINALYPALRQKYDEKKNFVLISTDMSLSYEQIKTTLRQMLPDFFNLSPKTESDMIMPFIIAKERTLKGQVLSNYDNVKKAVNLLNAYDVSGNWEYQFFGESKIGKIKTASPKIRFNSLFYLYRFLTDDNEEYFLLSSDELEITSCSVDGMLANSYDFIKIGNIARINTTQKIFFVHTQKPIVKRVDEKQFWEDSREFNTLEGLAKAVFGNYPHPEWFQKFIIAWMLSAKMSNMPTHLSLMSPPSVGKSHMLANLTAVVGENKNDAGTIRGLVPSFVMGKPNEGYLIKCKRFGFVDEFIHIIQTSARNGSDFDGGSYMLLKVLEHTIGEFSSAFGIIRAKPKMWTLFVSNIRPCEHIANLVDFHRKLNAAFMSRLLWYIYDEDHMRYIQEKKTDAMLLTETDNPKHNPKLLSIIDFCHEKMLSLPVNEVKKIHEKHRCLVPADLESDIYDSRMIMHIYRMLDGYVKLNSIIQNRKGFKLEPQDIQEVDALIERIVKSWSIGVKEEQLTPLMRISYLTGQQKEVYDLVKMNQSQNLTGVDEINLTSLINNLAINTADQLCKKGILKSVMKNNGVKSYYTHDYTL